MVYSTPGHYGNRVMSHVEAEVSGETVLAMARFMVAIIAWDHLKTLENATLTTARVKPCTCAIPLVSYHSFKI